MQIIRIIIRNTVHSLRNEYITSIIICIFFVLAPTLTHAVDTPRYHLSNLIDFSVAPSKNSLINKPQNNTDLLSPESIPQYYATQLYLLEYYRRHNSIFGLRPIRPFNFDQQLGFYELYESQGIRNHDFNLGTNVRLTQLTDTSILSPKQRMQSADWRHKEGVVLEKGSCPDNTKCNDRALSALHRMGIYDAQLAPARKFDYTLFLGGSIQDMQIRMISLLSTLHLYRNNKNFQLGTVYALTCDRIIPRAEYKQHEGMTFLNIQEHNGTPMVETSEGYEVLTETTAFRGIVHSVHKFCDDIEYYQEKRFTPEGYHPSRPVSFLRDDSYESVLYERVNNGFLLNKHFRRAACDYKNKSNGTQTFETKQSMSGIDRIDRPTTKKTVKKWLSMNGELSCNNSKQCEFLTVSNAPFSFYQHLAVLQGLEESILTRVDKRYQLTTAGAAAAYDIPMGYALDTVTKILYLEERHPPE